MSGPRTKWISTPIPVGYTPSGPFSQIWDYDYRALLVSVGHRCHNGTWTGGGPFACYRKTLYSEGELTQPYIYFDVPYIGRAKGVVGIAGGAPPVVPSAPSSASLLASAQAYGLKGYNRTRPGRPVADLGVFLVELRNDGLPTLPFTKGLFGSLLRGMPLNRIPGELQARVKKVLDVRNKTGGSEYLNVEFGWKPLVRDLRKLYSLWQTIDKRIADIVKNNGRGVRRRAELVDTTDTFQTSADYGYAFVGVLGAPPNFFDSGGSRWTVTRTTREHIWYSSKYIYWIPDTSSSQWGLRARAALFGALPTPELVWNVMPWSWLADWFSNVGDLMSAISPGAVENLVQLYGYTMRHTVDKTVGHVWTWHGLPPQPESTYHRHWRTIDMSFSSTLIEEAKTRAGGFNPFGPDVSPLDLSPKQVGILSALGLSKFGK